VRATNLKLILGVICLTWPALAFISNTARAETVSSQAQAGKEACDTLHFLNESFKDISDFDARFKAAENLASRAALDLIPYDQISAATKAATGVAVAGSMVDLGAGVIVGYKKVDQLALQTEIIQLRRKIAAEGASAAPELAKRLAVAESEFLLARTWVRKAIFVGTLARWAAKFSAGAALFDLTLEILQTPGDVAQKAYLKDPLHKGEKESSTMEGFLSREPLRLLNYVPAEACKILNNSRAVRDRFNWEASLILSIGSKASLKPAAITAKQGKDVAPQPVLNGNELKCMKASYAQ